MKIARSVAAGLMVMLVLPAFSLAAGTMNDYCVVPPFIGRNLSPNLLLMVDNSSSMYDLAYSDQGNTDGSGTITRQPYYCYDETYRTNACSGDATRRCSADSDCDEGQTCRNVYAGYFDNKKYYSFDFADSYFDVVASFPAAASCNYYVGNNLCIGVNATTHRVDYFVASGNYLNWLTSSKFDVEKKILTGGKYVTKLCSSGGVASDRACTVIGDCLTGETCTAVASTFLQSESRGCAGQPYIKTALTADFVNFTTTDTNTRLGITFSVRGPFDSANRSTPSRGGQTYIDIFKGTYDNQKCETATRTWFDTSSSQADLRDAVQSCINYNSGGSNFCSAEHAMTCTTDSNCIVSTPATLGGCSNSPATTCSADAACGTTTTPGSCSNQSRSCTQNSDCNIGGSLGACSNQSATCTQSSDCTIVTVNGTCSNQARSCAQASDCTKAEQKGTCSNNSTNSGQLCSAAADCPTAEVLGHCSVDTGLTCRSAANCASYYCSNNTNKGCTTLGADCSGSNGTCVAQTCNGYVAAGVGTCNNYVAGSTGTCNGYTPGSTGTCSGYVAPSTGTCDGILVTPNTCSSPPPHAAATANYGPCVNPTQSGEVKTKIAFTETVQTCWSYLDKGQAIGTGDYNRLIGGNKCDTVYSGWGICSGDSTRGCSIDTDCSAGGYGTCTHGPATIQPGNPAMICGNSYLGQFCNWNAGTSSCAWNTSNSAAIITAYQNFCNAQQPTVIDPTDSAASSTNYEQLPTLLGGMGVQGQLGSAIGTLPVRTKIDTAALPNGPSGLVQEFENRLRIGAMSFNFNGSATEAASGASILPPKICSNDQTRICSINQDCLSGGTCGSSSAGSTNLDGAQVLHPIGLGVCATMTTSVCTSNANCSNGNTCIDGLCGTRNTTPCVTDRNCSGDTCISSGAGTHSSGLVNTLDKIRANAWTPFAEAFYNAIGYFAALTDVSGNVTGSRTDLKLNSGDFDATQNPSQYRCQQNYTLLVTDGSSTADQNSSVNGVASLYATAAGRTAGTCSSYAGSKNFPIMTWLGKHVNIANFSTSSPATVPVCSVSGASCSIDTDCPSGQTCLNAPKQGRDSITTYIVSTGGSNGLAGDCNSATMMANAASAGGTSLKQANNPNELETALRSVFQELAAKSASGTAASILSNSEGSGANILQALFYPRKIFENDTQGYWLGELNNLWYYVDPFIGRSSMREDTTQDKELRLSNDYVVQFGFDPATGMTFISKVRDTDGDGLGDLTMLSRVSPDDSTNGLKALWQGGRQLWERNLEDSPRTIYTSCITGATCVVDTGLMKFSETSPDNSSFLRTKLQASTDPAASKLIRWVHGFDYPGDTTMRSRTVKMGNIPASSVSTDPDSLYVQNPKMRGKGVWKLGDIISSTPRLQSSIRQNAYNLPRPVGYGDASYGDDVNKRGYIYTPSYADRGIVYAGANDGMLHAFKLGTLNVIPSGDRKAELTGSDLGKEIWSFIPQNVLPYLKYYADPGYEGNNHLYSVDGNTAIVDASVGYPAGCDPDTTDYWDCAKDTSGTGSNWRTILVGGMGIGGASRNSTDGCTEGGAGTCVKTPVNGVGYSSYYALDITVPDNPKYLWEFSDAVLPDTDKGLGFATSGAAIVKISAKTLAGGVLTPDNSKNGRWYAVFASGPTGPIDTSSHHRFLGTSNQPLKVYVVDLNAKPPFVTGDPDWTKNNYWVISTVYDGGTSSTATVSSASTSTLANAFGGNMAGATIDIDRWDQGSAGFYQDDALYFGYSQKDDSALTWTKGGVLKLVTSESPNPADWKIVKVFDGIGPVTTGISRLQDRKHHFLWLFFGTGRYFYMKDDFDAGRKIYGIKEPCYRDGMGGANPKDTLNPLCAVKHSGGDETNQTNATSTDTTINSVGWSITLDPKDDSDPNNIQGGERLITDPVAMTNGAVFYTTYKPNFDFCQFGGNSYMWAVQYDTGTQAPAASLQGRALVQVSTGEFREIDLSTAFTSKNNRRMSTPMTGKPPVDPPPIVSKSSNKPVRRMLHIQER
jgi:type IV pilus assembly protein PilY1